MTLFSSCSEYFCNNCTSERTREPPLQAIYQECQGDLSLAYKYHLCLFAVMAMPVYLKGASIWKAEEEDGKGEVKKLLVLGGQTDRKLLPLESWGTGKLQVKL